LFGWFSVLYCSFLISGIPMRVMCWGVLGVTLGISMFAPVGGGCGSGWVGLGIGKV